MRARRAGGKGAPRFLNADPERALVKAVQSGRFRTAAQIRDRIQDEYGASDVAASVCRVLRRLGCARRLPGPRRTRADVARQEA